jgi:hypothetical protein
LIETFMNVMAYREEFLGRVSGEGLSHVLPPPGTSASSDPAPEVSFERPGADVVNGAIPVIFIGRNRDGLWVARDAEGKFGGLFWRRQSALRFARRRAATTGCATVYPRVRFELDTENAGSALAGYAGSAKRFLTRQTGRLCVAVRKRFDSEARRLASATRYTSEH